MRIRHQVVMLVATLTSAAYATPWGLLTSTALPEVASGRVVVKYKPGQEKTGLAAIKKMGGQVLKSIPKIGWAIVKVPKTLTVSAAVDRLSTQKPFSQISPVYSGQKLEVPNDPLFNLQYGAQRMQLPLAWDLGKAGRDVIIAIVDDGVDSRHPDLTGRVMQGYDTADEDTNTISSFASDTHGTHVAGIAAASANNGIGVAGVAYDATIMPVKVFSDGSGGVWDDDMAEGIIYAADHGAQVINMSIGFGYAIPVSKDAIDYARSKGVTIVAAAGNSGHVGNPLSWPAYFDNVIAVGASDINDQRAYFSEFNPVDGSDDWVDVAAPGAGIVSTVTGNGYEPFDGTSMASPQVAGLAGLIIGYAGVGNLTNDEVRAYIEDNTDDIGTWISRGRVNAYKALNAIGVPLLDVPVPATPTAYDGTVSYPSNAFSTTDGVSATIQSVRKPGVGLTGSFTTSVNLTGMTYDEVRKATLSVTLSGDPLATMQVYVQDLSGTWKMVANHPGTVSGKTTDITILKDQLVRYMTTSGQLRVMVRSFVPTRLMGRAKAISKVDMLRVAFNGVRKPGATP